MKLAIYKPKNIEITNTTDEKFKKASDEIDGPGHNPVIPHPILPNLSYKKIIPSPFSSAVSIDTSLFL